MIKTVAHTDKGPIIVFGLSHENLRRLKEGQPIRVDLRELGLSGHVLIFSGQTEITMMAEIADLIGPDTIVKGVKQ